MKCDTNAVFWAFDSLQNACKIQPASLSLYIYNKLRSSEQIFMTFDTCEFYAKIAKLLHFSFR